MSHHTPTRLTEAWPAGAIRTSAQLLDLVIEARREKRAIRLFAVEQSGNVREMLLYSKSRLVRNKNDGLCVGPAFDKVNVYNDYAPLGYRNPKARYLKTDILSGSYNLDGLGHTTCHRLFQNRRLATAYSEALKSDEEYMASVKAWHAHCARVFSWEC